MRTHAAGNIPCALVRLRPPVSGVALVVISSVPSCTKKNRAAIGGDAYHIKPRITCIDRVIIRDYFRLHGSVPLLRPADRGALFPESRKYLLPGELERRLSVPFPGHERILAGSDVLLVETATREIVDVMRNARTTSGPGGHATRERDRALASINLPGDMKIPVISTHQSAVLRRCRLAATV